MREVNFSIPNVNKASVGITAALYDRRALDCTSTLPLINSLNHLAYLTTSSARIRDILTVDGGVERLVCILKEGRDKEMMEMWKWNLAFQCVVNIGVRGSEAVRTRVVEADMVPVIATILDNYVQVMDKVREEKDAETRRTAHRPNAQRPTARLAHDHDGRPVQHHRHHSATDQRSIRRQAAPPAIEIPQPYSQPTQFSDQQSSETFMHVVAPNPQLPSMSPPERHHSSRQHTHHGHHHRQHYSRSQDLRASLSRRDNALAPIVAPMDAADGFGLRPVRDTERLPSMIPALQNGITSQPESPTTPSAPSHHLSITTRNRRRPSLRQEQSNSGDSDEGGSGASPAHSATGLVAEEAMLDIQANVNIGGGDGSTTMIDAVTTPLDLTAPPGPDGTDIEAFNLGHRVGMEGSIITTNVPDNTDANATIGLRPPPPPLPPMSVPTPTIQPVQGRYLLDRSVHPGVLAANPRDEDVMMSLQLLAYVSKYCNLRSYFQCTHLVPALRLANSSMQTTESKVLDDRRSRIEVPYQEEYTLPDDYNMFPLVEKFTVRHNSQDMQYWAGVVMRNLCRKDDSRGGIRQCAYYQCGQWEKYTRQFAKCRRCRRTKYCSKECQKHAWVYHRHWCQVASS